MTGIKNFPNKIYFLPGKFLRAQLWLFLPIFCFQLSYVELGHKGIKFWAIANTLYT